MDESVMPKMTNATPLSKNGMKEVFIVHGHRDSLKYEVAHLIHSAGLKPIILHEQPNMGGTLIEKLQNTSDVAFAIILITGDDKGGSIQDSMNEYKPRARQNVIFEFGFFYGKIGRKNVVALYEDGVDLPSDLKGIVYSRVDQSGGWKTELLREMKAAGIKIDLNTITV
jgi:predicted nucleotide-binding protein